MTKRLLVYFFWDAEGVVDDYVLSTLQALRSYSARILVVVNGPLTPAGETRLKEVSDHL